MEKEGIKFFDANITRRGEITDKSINFFKDTNIAMPSIFEILNRAPGTIEFFLGSISAALYLLLNVNLKLFKLIFFIKRLSLHLLFI